jgi:hypothetical protein
VNAPGVRILFELGARLHKSAAEMERLSVREIAAWRAFFSEGAAEPEPAEPEGLDPRTASREEMRGAFSHG